MTELAAFAPWLAALLAVGAVAGLMAGLFGVGGGIVIVPVLFALFIAQGVDAGLAIKLAVGTSLATIIPTSLSSVRAHHGRGAVDWILVRRWAPGVVLGVAMGSWLADRLDGALLQAIFGAVAALVGLKMATAFGPARLADALPGPLGLGALGWFVGTVSALVGIGGGSLTVPIMTIYGQKIRRAVATAAAIGSVIAVVGTAGFIITGSDEVGLPPSSLGYVSLPALIGIVAASWFTAPVGARLAHGLPVDLLQRGFGLFLVGVGLKMLYQAM